MDMKSDTFPNQYQTITNSIPNIRRLVDISRFIQRPTDPGLR